MKKMDKLLINEIKESKKICLFGCPGSGKSTLGKKLSVLLNLNVITLIMFIGYLIGINFQKKNLILNYLNY